jgi:hypothetical protein
MQACSSVWRWLTHDASGFFSLWLVLVGIGQAALFYVQLRLMRKTLGPTEKAAEAALLQAKAILSAERPYIHPDAPNVAGFLPSGANAVYPENPGVPRPNIEIKFFNVGRSYGIIKELRAEISLDKIAPVPTFTYSPIQTRGAIIVRPDNETNAFVFEFERNLTKDEIDQFGVGSRSFFIFGYIKYADAFEALHTKGFCFKVTLHKGPIELAGGNAYNYSKSEMITDKYAM